MALKKKPYFYSASLKRMIVQILACFAGYQVRTGNLRDGQHKFMDVPILYGTMDRAVGYIIQGGSENTVSYIPIMSLIMTGMQQQDSMRHAPQHVEKLQIIQRAKDSDGNIIANQPGEHKTIERYQPVPYELTFELSIWTSNYDQAYQLIEQIGVVFNPELDIALSNSILDWAFLTTLHMSPEIRIETAQPSGTDSDPLNVHSITFTTTIWISPPVKVLATKNIHTIHVPILDLGENSGEAILQDTIIFDELDELDKIIVKADENDIRFATFG